MDLIKKVLENRYMCTHCGFSNKLRDLKGLCPDCGTTVIKKDHLFHIWLFYYFQDKTGCPEEFKDEFIKLVRYLVN